MDALLHGSHPPMQAFPTAAAALSRPSNTTLRTLRRASMSSVAPSVFASQFDTISISSRVPRADGRDREAGSRPMYRDDIFYGASASRLGLQLQQQQQQQQTSARTGTTTLSLSRLPATDDAEEERSRRCSFCPHAVTRTLSTLLDVSLLTNRVFLAFAMMQVVAMLGYFTPFIFMPAQAMDAGVPFQYREWILPAMGLSNAVGRALCGIICELPGVSALNLTSLSLTLAGIVVGVTTVSKDAKFQIMVAVAYGLFVAPFMSMKSLVLVDFLGIEKLSNSFGLILMFQGFAVMIGPPFAGLIRDYTNSYTWTFIVAGFCLFLAAHFAYVMYCITALEKRRATGLA